MESNYLNVLLKFKEIKYIDVVSLEQSIKIPNS